MFYSIGSWSNICRQGLSLPDWSAILESVLIIVSPEYKYWAILDVNGSCKHYSLLHCSNYYGRKKL
jgi:hypothetical protein